MQHNLHILTTYNISKSRIKIPEEDSGIGHEEISSTKRKRAAESVLVGGFSSVEWRIKASKIS